MPLPPTKEKHTSLKAWVSLAAILVGIPSAILWWGEKTSLEIKNTRPAYPEATARLLDEGNKILAEANATQQVLGNDSVPKPLLTKEQIAAGLAKMKSEYDKFEKVTWYSDKSTTPYNNVNSFHLYIGKDDAEQTPRLRLRIQYAADDWLFIRKYSIMIDGKAYDFPPVDFERDHNSRIWEWRDIPMSSSGAIAMMDKIIQSQETIIRYYGEQYYKDREIGKKEKIALKNVLDAFYALGGNIE